MAMRDQTLSLEKLNKRARLEEPVQGRRCPIHQEVTYRSRFENVGLWVDVVRALHVTHVATRPFLSLNAREREYLPDSPRQCPAVALPGPRLRRTR